MAFDGFLMTLMIIWSFSMLCWFKCLTILCHFIKISVFPPFQVSYSLVNSQFQREVTIVEGQEVSCYVYTEFGSKNRQGGLKNRVVHQFQNLFGSGPCHVQILDPYFAKLSSQAKEKMCFISHQTSLLVKVNNDIY